MTRVMKNGLISPTNTVFGKLMPIFTNQYLFYWALKAKLTGFKGIMVNSTFVK